MITGHSYREVSTSHRLERVKQLLRRVGISVCVGFDFGTTTSRRSGGAEITHEYSPQAAKALASEHIRVVFLASNRAGDSKSSEILEVLQMFRFLEPEHGWNNSGRELLFPDRINLSIKRV
jgi:hypothetical protein